MPSPIVRVKIGENEIEGPADQLPNVFRDYPNARVIGGPTEQASKVQDISYKAASVYQNNPYLQQLRKTGDPITAGVTAPFVAAQRTPEVLPAAGMMAATITGGGPLALMGRAALGAGIGKYTQTAVEDAKRGQSKPLVQSSLEALDAAKQGAELEAGAQTLGMGLGLSGKGFSKVGGLALKNLPRFLAGVTGYPESAFKYYLESGGNMVMGGVNPEALQEISVKLGEGLSNLRTALGQQLGQITNSVARELPDTPILNLKVLRDYARRKLTDSAGNISPLLGQIEELLTPKISPIMTEVAEQSASKILGPGGQPLTKTVTKQVINPDYGTFKQATDIQDALQDLTTYKVSDSAGTMSRQTTNLEDSVIKTLAKISGDAASGAAKRVRGNNDYAATNKLFSSLISDTNQIRKEFMGANDPGAKLESVFKKEGAALGRLQALDSRLPLAQKFFDKAKSAFTTDVMEQTSRRIPQTGGGWQGMATGAISGSGLGGTIGNYIAGPVGGAVGGMVGTGVGLAATPWLSSPSVQGKLALGGVNAARGLFNAGSAVANQIPRTAPFLFNKDRRNLFQ